jgi:hypothetical protein
VLRVQVGRHKHHKEWGVVAVWPQENLEASRDEKRPSTLVRSCVRGGGEHKRHGREAHLAVLLLRHANVWVGPKARLAQHWKLRAFPVLRNDGKAIARGGQRWVSATA